MNSLLQYEPTGMSKTTSEGVVQTAATNDEVYECTQAFRKLMPYVFAVASVGSLNSNCINNSTFYPTGSNNLAALIQNETFQPERLVFNQEPVNEMLANFRAAFLLTIKEAAAILRVERPTIYAWLSENVRPHADNLRRLHELSNLAKEYASRAQGAITPIRKYAAPQGESVFELMCQEPLDILKIREALHQITHVSKDVEKPKRHRSAREAARALGLDPTALASQERLDFETGKRIADDNEV
ncbi:MAG: helix-turn-helix domain-containing protein [Deltaproteobacteria bacterium]|nr:helix-turn-helix domain-containing protein [Deltaproteobacteria bacterium]